MVALDVKAPFSFAQTLGFISAFPVNRDVCVLSASQLTSAVAIGGRAHAFTLREKGSRMEIEVHGKPSAATRNAVIEHATDLIGARDDVGPLYAAATGDGPFEQIIEELRGLHHVRFGTLADAVVYSVLMQRAPMPVAAALKRKFLAKLGHPIEVEGRTLYAMPELAELAALDEGDIAGAIGHRPKSQRIATVSRAVATLGEPFLKTAPYATARDALLEISGVGPFAAAAILLRGLGRMDELPWMPAFDQTAAKLYGRRVAERTLVERYGRHIGYWSFYAMTGLGRRERALH